MPVVWFLRTLQEQYALHTVDDNIKIASHDTRLYTQFLTV